MSRSNGVDWDPVTLEILWSRVVSIVDEAAATLIKTSFSDVVREAHDFACMLMNTEGEAIANSAISIPVFLGSVSQTVKHILAEYPVADWKDGDVAITNDAWLGTGHQRDVTLVRPVLQDQRVVAFAACTAQVADIGGSIWSADATEVFEEGLRILPTLLFAEGRANDELFKIIFANVRVPELVQGDLLAMVAALDRMAGRAIELIEDAGIGDFAKLGTVIQGRTESAMRAAIDELPDGLYSSTTHLDGIDGKALSIRCAIGIRGSEIHVDYAGTSDQVRGAINVVMNHTFSYTAAPLKSIIDPFVPNNEGALRPLTVTAPRGSILNAQFPVAVDARSLVSHYLHAAIFSALEGILPDSVIGHCGGPGVRAVFSGLRDGEFFSATVFTFGGMGAGKGSDGLGSTSFPTIASCPPIEVLESIAPILIREKSILGDSGGLGINRGGPGHRFTIEVLHDRPVECSLMGDRLQHPPLGVLGGAPGSPVQILLNGRELTDAKHRLVLHRGDVLTIDGPGGGGYGPPNGLPSSS